MRMPIKLIPQEFIDLYDLNTKVKNGYVYIEIQKGMYGLPQAGILANKLLKTRLAPRLIRGPTYARPLHPQDSPNLVYTSSGRFRHQI